MKRAFVVALFGLVAEADSATPTIATYYPDLRTDPFVLGGKLSVTKDVTGARWLNYAFGGANYGPGHLAVVGDGPAVYVNGKYQIQARQAVWQSNGYAVSVGAAGSAGKFVYHTGAGHNHWHYNNYAAVSLQSISPPYYATVTAPKQSFCLVDIRRTPGFLTTHVGQPAELPLTIAVWDGTGPRNYTLDCNKPLNALQLAQGISDQWVDIYDPELNVPLRVPGNGRFKLKGTVDPDGRIVETLESNNSSYVIIDVYGTTVTVVQYGPQ